MAVISGDHNSRIVQKIGASVLGIASGGSLEFDVGGVILSSGINVFSGGFTIGQGSVTVVAGGLISTQTGASVTINLTTADAGTFKITDGTRGPTIFSLGVAAPTHTASPGTFYLRTDGSRSAPYVNTSDGTTGSVWTVSASG